MAHAPRDRLGQGANPGRIVYANLMVKRPEKKFLFDVSFDADAETDGARADLRTETPEPEPPEPEIPVGPPLKYTEDDFQLARDEARSLGRSEGRQEARESTEHQAADALKKVAEALGRFDAAVEKARDDAEITASRLAMTVVRHLLPGLAEKTAEAEIERLLGTVMPMIVTEPRITVRVPESLAETVDGRLKQISEQFGYEGKLLVFPEAGLPPGEVQVEWSSGGAQRSLADLLEEAEAIVQQNLIPAPDVEPQRSGPDQPDPQQPDSEQVNGNGPAESEQPDETAAADAPRTTEGGPAPPAVAADPAAAERPVTETEAAETAPDETAPHDAAPATETTEQK